jgi:hypothetical protein
MDHWIRWVAHRLEAAETERTVGERFPGPLMNMSPAGLPGLLVVTVVAVGMWSLFGEFFVAGLGVAATAAVLVALALRSRRVRHPGDHSVLHLGLEPDEHESSKDV